MLRNNLPVILPNQSVLLVPLSFMARLTHQSKLALWQA